MESNRRWGNAKRTIARSRPNSLAINRGDAIVQLDVDNKERDGKGSQIIVQGSVMLDKKGQKIFVGSNIIFVMGCINIVNSVKYMIISVD